MQHLEVTHHTTVTEDQIDHLGHMNVRFYAVAARAGTRALLEGVPGTDAVALELHDVYTRHHREQLLGAELEVRSGVVAADSHELRLYHELATTDGSSLAATFFHTLRPPAGATLPASVVAHALTRTVEVPGHGATRTVSLDDDPESMAPALDHLLIAGLAMRRQRRIALEECDGSGDVTWEALPGLTWGGEQLDDTEWDPLDRTEDGRPMGWATMETRMTLFRVPRAGDRIQSFGAVVGIADKTVHRMQWAYDLDRATPITAFEIVNLAFDIEHRQAISIPVALRRREEAQLRPDLIRR